jgi:hypothetical protein
MTRHNANGKASLREGDGKPGSFLVGESRQWQTFPGNGWGNLGSEESCWDSNGAVGRFANGIRVFEELRSWVADVGQGDAPLSAAGSSATIKFSAYLSVGVATS